MWHAPVSIAQKAPKPHCWNKTNKPTSFCYMASGWGWLLRVKDQLIVLRKKEPFIPTDGRLGAGERKRK